MALSTNIHVREQQIGSVVEAVSWILPESIGVYLYGSAVLSACLLYTSDAADE